MINNGHQQEQSISPAEEKITMNQVADAANASVSTVSRVFNGSGYPVNPETKQRILAAAQQLGYSYRLQNKNTSWEDSVSVKSNRILGVIVPNLTNPHYTILLQGIEDLATRNNYNILLCNANRNAEKERDFIRLLQNMRVKGMMIAPTNENIDLLEEFHHKGGHIVSLTHKLPFPSDSVGFNYLQTGFLAADYLWNLGHRRLAYFSSPLTTYVRKELQKGFFSSLRGHGITEKDILLYVPEIEEEIMDDNYEYLLGRELTRTMLRQGDYPTAIFCGNDMIATGVIHQLQEAQIHVPRDISVLGFDNIPFSRMTSPQLTTIDQGSFELGVISCDVLIKRMNDDLVSNVSFSIEPTLIERESTRQI